ncbi:hypothetical protein [Lentiprolixibacter aurantiacus]|uniref:Uncharacterized protein n=1 Tax=Lentiprolixibacter aurantiacus TaxID=2993939 RepID=A0AAE3MLK1_9FLAO|nr:hypothetical protein [Lentiprolixibacter aurantiacus]MCX2719408.1 hypothetical protein [Lentiprolixibacter aurantiacus]
MQREGFRKNLRIRLDGNPPISGLDDFKRNLEKDYYSTALVRSCSQSGDRGNLVVEMHCPLALNELLFHLQNGHWGTGNMDYIHINGANPLTKRVWQLQQLNECPIEIEELALELNDVTLIIKKIYPHSVEMELDLILAALTEHHTHFANGKGESPYEIYIPVIEEQLIPIQPKFSETISKYADPVYLRYWALYFDSEEDAVIYDLRSRSFISGDLHMLNH